MQNNTVVIEPLSEKTLKGALKVLDTVFGYHKKDKEMYTNAFAGSLNMNKYKLLNGRKEKPTYLQYYVAIDKKSKKVVGTTGLYAHSELGPGKMGTGWFCVDPNFRGKGIGKLLLDFTIEKARERKAPILFLWTTADPSEKVAHEMYEGRGFKIVKKEKSLDYKYEVINMELKL